MILDEIVAYKRNFLGEKKRELPLDQVKKAVKNAPQPHDFHAALCSQKAGMSVIAEVKKASPSRGVIRKDFDPVDIARRYEKGGAAAVSVLTDEKFFQGSLDFLQAIRKGVNLPLLRKEFIIDEYQVYEARGAGADAVLLITAILSPKALASLYELTRKLEMSALVEVHTEEELNQALSISPRIIGINNRNLKDFTVDINQTIRLREGIPDSICVVSESGIKNTETMDRLLDAGARGFLVGTALMRSENVGEGLRRLVYM